MESWKTLCDRTIRERHGWHISEKEDDHAHSSVSPVQSLGSFVGGHRDAGPLRSGGLAATAEQPTEGGRLAGINLTDGGEETGR